MNELTFFPNLEDDFSKKKKHHVKRQETKYKNIQEDLEEV